MPRQPPPSAEHWPLIESLFERASELPAAERAAFLDRECPDDEPARREVEALFLADRTAVGFLDLPLELAAGAALSSGSSVAASADSPGALSPGTLIGAYRIVRELGHGGMGAVYLADRADGAYSQQVALKVVRGGLIAGALERRFLRERQILARLQHPNIARLLDGGFTHERLPYLAMEFVEGEPLTRWAESRSLDVERRLRLFLEVCEAVQHAHRQLVVHRDLKPANILVTPEGHVRLLDFGIARLLDDASEEGEALTRTGLLLLTPEYAAPEQVRGEAPTTATDVYALGAVLYELLCGEKAYEFRSHALSDILRVLDQEIPPLAHRSDLPKALRKRLSGDLETIVHRALAREPERRYSSAEALAADIRRHLEHRPVEARPDSVGYRFSKYIRRNRIGVSATAAIIVAVTIGVAGTIWQSREARREALRAQAMSELLYGSFAAVDPATAKGRAVTAREILDAAARRIDTVDNLSVRVDVLRTIGELYMKLGVFEQSQVLLIQARDEARTLFGERSPEAATVLNVYAEMLIEKGDYDGARAAAQEARSIGESVRNPGTIVRDSIRLLANVSEFKTEYEESEALYRQALAIDTAAYGVESAQVGHDLAHLGYLLVHREAYDDAEKTLKDAYATLTRTVGREHEDSANAVGVLGLLYGKLGRWQEAEQRQREELEIRTLLYGPVHQRVALSLDQLAGHIMQQGRHMDAEPMLEKSLQIRRRLFGDAHLEIADTLNSLAMLRYTTGDLRRALEDQEKVVEIDRVVLGVRHRSTAAAISNLGRFQRDAGDFAAAERTLNEALALRTEMVGPIHSETATTLVHLATLHRMQNRLAEAEREYRQALEVLSKNLPEDHPRIAEVRVGIGAALVASGRSAEALSMLEQARNTLRTKIVGDDIRLAEADLWLGVGLARIGRAADARPYLESSHTMLLRLRSADHPWTRLAVQESSKAAR